MQNVTREEQWLLNEKYNGIQTEAFFAECKQLANGEPLAYIIGSIPFLNTTIHLDSRPLIPRPETEFWVVEAIAAIKEATLKLRDSIPKLEVLDLCAGSGAIGVAVLTAVKETHVAFAEIDKTHEDTIVKNCAENKISKEQYSLHFGDLFTTIPLIDKKFDYILTNPPYIDPRANTVNQSVTDNEPAIALFGGTNGFELIETIIKEAVRHLKLQGTLYIEHEPAQANLIQQCATFFGYTCTTHIDQYEVNRFSVLVLQ